MNLLSGNNKKQCFQLYFQLVDGSDYTIGGVTSNTDDTTVTTTNELEIPSFASGDVGDYKCQSDYDAPVLDDESTAQTINVLGELLNYKKTV